MKEHCNVGISVYWERTVFDARKLFYALVVYLHGVCVVQQNVTEEELEAERDKQEEIIIK